ncbi:Hypothetical_protein [Hexamita inflata]|uniref:Hypothetical_protein n=1 Tax=Hexamita inflata TaxID=28002 RepID=A0AA86TWZ1_9EUKA|nr:Hypothetical protein HINF_LOCUS20055 [Hexamita inflata]
MIENFKLPRTITTSWSDVDQIGRYTWNYPTLESIQLHFNFNNFNLDDQDEPTKEEIEVANIMRYINSPITSLKQINEKSSRIKNQNIFIRQKITQQLQQSNNTLEQFVTRVVLLFQKMNLFI